MAGNLKAENLKALRDVKMARSDSEVPPRLLVLVGIPGSGKSTFADEMKKLGFQVVCQDELGDRRACERATVDSFIRGRDVIVDRCNFDAQQRKHWVDYGKACGAAMGVIVFGTPLEECINRVRNRYSHPTLGPGGAGDRVVHKMASDFVFPTEAEGFGFCRVLRSEADTRRVVGELSAWVGMG